MLHDDVKNLVYFQVNLTNNPFMVSCLIALVFLFFLWFIINVILRINFVGGQDEG